VRPAGGERGRKVKVEAEIRGAEENVTKVMSFYPSHYSS
jgi:hypothetical protein